jgi:Zn ribbon nucleic-acid-binding protein
MSEESKDRRTLNKNNRVSIEREYCLKCGHDKAFIKYGINVSGRFCCKCGAKHENNNKGIKRKRNKSLK